MSADPLNSGDVGRPPTLRTVRQRMAALLGVGVLTLGSAGLAACGEGESAGPESAGAASAGADSAGADADADAGRQEPAQGASAQPAEVTLGELLEDPSAYVGQAVTVSGQVTDLDVDRDAASPAAFTLGEDVDDDLLVLPTTQADIVAADITDDSVVRVQGVVREVNDALAARGDFLFEQRDDAWMADLTDEVAVAATRIDADIPRDDDPGADAAG